MTASICSSNHSSPKFVIFTNKTDITCDFIVREMRNRQLNFARVNTEDLAQAGIVHCLGQGTALRLGERIIELNQIGAAYFRRPSLPDIEAGAKSPSSIQYIKEEWNYILRSIYLELDNKWFNHPNKIILAEDKPKQLRLAQEIGFQVPETVITNDIDSIKYLFKTGEVVAKPMKHSLLEDDKDSTSSVIYTTTIDSLAEIDAETLNTVPVIFQSKINTRFDLRVTVVDQDVFSVAINSQALEQTRTDWRHGSVSNLDHEIYELPENINEYCRKIVSQLGLRYGAIDLVMDENGDIWFLECNPNGQWAWIESRTGQRISAAIVNTMERIAQ